MRKPITPRQRQAVQQKTYPLHVNTTGTIVKPDSPLLPGYEFTDKGQIRKVKNDAQS